MNWFHFFPLGIGQDKCASNFSAQKATQIWSSSDLDRGWRMKVKELDHIWYISVFRFLGAWNNFPNCFPWQTLLPSSLLVCHSVLSVPGLMIHLKVSAMELYGWKTHSFKHILATCVKLLCKGFLLLLKLPWVELMCQIYCSDSLCSYLLKLLWFFIAWEKNEGFWF